MNKIIMTLAILIMAACTPKMLPDGTRKMSSGAIKREIKRYIKHHPLPEEDLKFLSTHPLKLEFDTAQKK